jgi:hypothetical protein
VRTHAGSENPLSSHPNTEGQTSEGLDYPDIETIELSSAPYADVIGILRSTLKQAERDVALNPNDQSATELERSIRHMIDDLESKTAESCPG